jgi:hypothetical protein
VKVVGRCQESAALTHWAPPSYTQVVAKNKGSAALAGAKPRLGERGGAGATAIAGAVSLRPNMQATVPRMPAKNLRRVNLVIIATPLRRLVALH